MQTPLVVFCACIAVGLLSTLTKPRLYESHARVWVQLGAPGPSARAAGNYTPYVYSDTSPIATACEVMKSAAVLAEAGIDLHKRFPGKTVPDASEIRSRLIVEPVRNTSVIEVSYRDASDWAATGVVQALVDSFVATNGGQITSTHETGATHAAAPAVTNAGEAENGSTTQLLSGELKSAQADYAKAKARYQSGRQSQPGAVSEEQLATFLRERAQLDSELSDAKAQYAGLESKVAFLEAQLGTTAENALADEKLTKDLIIQNLRKKIAEDEVRLVGLRSKYEDAHPKVRDLLDTIKSGHDALSERLKQVIGPPSDSGVGYTSDRLPPDSQMRQSLLSDLVRAKTDEITLEARIGSLKSQSSDLGRKIDQAPAGQHLSVSELARQEKDAFDHLSDVQRRLQAARLRDAEAAHEASQPSSHSIGAGGQIVRVIDEPSVPKEPIAPDLAFPLGVSALIGFVLAMLAGLFSNARTPRLTNPQDVAAILEAPIISWVEPVGDNLEAVVPALLRLRVALKTSIARGVKKLFVTSSDTTDGKTLVSAGLAISLAESGQRVLLIDANFENPGLHQLFNVPRAPGLSNYLKDPASLALPKLVKRVHANLQLIPAGTAGDNGQLLASPGFHRLMNELGSGVDLIVVDAPSGLHSVDALALANGDAMVLTVVKLMHTLKHTLRQFAVQLQQQGTNCQIVLTNANSTAVANLPSYKRVERAPAHVG